MVQLSPLEKSNVSALFESHDLMEAERMLVEDCCDELPLINGKPVLLERVRVAALKVSTGDLAKLRTAIELAQKDWRDLLVAAGFADDLRAHEQWVPRRSGETKRN